MYFSVSARGRIARKKHLLIALKVDGRIKLSELAKEVNATMATVFEDLQTIRKEYRIVLRNRNTEPPAPQGCRLGGRQRVEQRKRERQERIIAALKQDGRAGYPGS